MTKKPGQHEAGNCRAEDVAISKATDRLGVTPPDDLVEEARQLTRQKVRVKKLPDWYAPLLLEDEIVEACIRAAINGRCSRCALSVT